jgi:RNA polymerase sigma factor (sigma-70 family)
MITAQLSEETDTIITNAVHRFRRRCPGSLYTQEFDELKHEAWLLLPKVEAEYDEKRCAGNFMKFAIQRLSWRLFDLARSKTWAPRSVSEADRRKQMSIAPVGTSEEFTIDDLDRYNTEHPANDLIEQDALRGLADRLESVLPANYRKEFELYYVHGLTMKETGKALGLTESRVSQKLTVARRIIHERFPDGEGATPN